MNGLVGTEPSGDVDSDGAGVANVLAIADATAWNDIAIDIVAGGAGTHVVTVSVNGEAAQSFDVTAGTGTEQDYAYIAIGSSGDRCGPRRSTWTISQWPTEARTKT